MNQKIIELIEDPKCLLIPFTNIHTHISELMQKCIEIAFAEKPLAEALLSTIKQIDNVLFYLHDHLNMGKWDEVPEYYRMAYTAASFTKTVIQLQLALDASTLKIALSIIDKGFLLGLPLQGYPNLLTKCASLLTRELNLMENDVGETSLNTCKKQKVSNTSKITEFPINKGEVMVDILQCPSIETFQNEYFLPRKPLVLKGCINHWPAMTKWHDLSYLLSVAGERTVPIELGSSYSAENFSQKLITLKEFVKNYILVEPEQIGYLAQHDLLSQIPQLAEDVRVPDYCCLNRSLEENNDEPEINAWFGPKGTVSSLHFDPKDNLLCQVNGTKQIILFAPKDSAYLYPYSEKFLQNTSQVDPINPDRELYSNFDKATMFKCVINSGDMLYIPPEWWHHVTALNRSFSVNFWWK